MPNSSFPGSSMARPSSSAAPSMAALAAAAASGDASDDSGSAANNNGAPQTHGAEDSTNPAAAVGGASSSSSRAAAAARRVAPAAGTTGSSPAAAAARSRGAGAVAAASGAGGVVPNCQVERCNADMGVEKRYNKRHKVCDAHRKASVVLLAGLRQRFCQQCSRFHELSYFDDTKRSCRLRLAGHNERRRRNPADAHDQNGGRGNPAGGNHFQIK